MCPNLPDVRIYPTLPYLSRLANNERKRHTFLFEDIEHKKHQALPYLTDHYKRAFGQGVKYGDEIQENICFCGRVPWLYQYWPGGFMLFVVQELPKAQPAVVLVLKRLRRRGNGLKSHPTDWEKPRILCNHISVDTSSYKVGIYIGPLYLKKNKFPIELFGLKEQNKGLQKKNAIQ